MFIPKLLLWKFPQFREEEMFIIAILSPYSTPGPFSGLSLLHRRHIILMRECDRAVLGVVHK